MSTLEELLKASEALHSHLCPRQVLGVRMGMLAGRLLGLTLPQTDKRLLVIAETDGCGVDGISVATGCWVGRRTLRIEDYGKVAATFVDTQSDRAIRIVPRAEARVLAGEYAVGARGKWETQLLGYQQIPDDSLFAWQSVQLTVPVATIISRPGRRASCTICGEEIMNEREVRREGTVLCRSCAGNAYYRVVSGLPGVTLQPVFTAQEIGEPAVR